MDHVLDTPRWFENDFGVGVREPSFLSNPRVPANVSGAVAKVKLPKGLNDKEVAKVLGAHAAAGVIEIDDPIRHLLRLRRRRARPQVPRGVERTCSRTAARRSA